jgi:hypothetical protein
MGMLDSMGDRMSPEGGPVFHCTMDDFGTCDKDGVRGFAGYVASKECWDNFNFHWDLVLKQFDLEYLHTAEFLKRMSSGLIGTDAKPRDDEDDYNILRPFLKVVREEIFNPGGFGVIVVTECAAYDALTDQEKLWVRPPGRNSFEMLIAGVCQRLSPQLGRHNPIAFQVDESDKADHLLTILKTYIVLKKQNPLYKKSLGGITFADDKMLRSLQAADMLGNLALKAWRRQKADEVWPKSAILAITNDGKTSPYARSYDKDRLKLIAATRKARGAKIPLLSDFDI